MIITTHQLVKKTKLKNISCSPSYKWLIEITAAKGPTESADDQDTAQNCKCVTFKHIQVTAMLPFMERTLTVEMELSVSSGLIKTKKIWAWLNAPLFVIGALWGLFLHEVKWAGIKWPVNTEFPALVVGSVDLWSESIALVKRENQPVICSWVKNQSELSQNPIYYLPHLSPALYLVTSPK